VTGTTQLMKKRMVRVDMLQVANPEASAPVEGQVSAGAIR